MLKLKALIENNNREWMNLTNEIERLLPENLVIKRYIQTVNSNFVKKSTAATIILKLYAYLNLLDNAISEKYIDKWYRYEGYSYHADILNVIEIAEREDYKNDEWIITGRIINEETIINDIMTRVREHQRMTALEQLVKNKNNQKVVIFRQNNKLVVLSTSDITLESFVRIINVHNKIHRTENPTKTNYAGKFIEALRKQDLNKINKVLSEISNLEIIKKARFDKYKSIFKPPQKVKLEEYTRKLHNIVEEMSNLESQYNHMLEKYKEVNVLYETLSKQQKGIDIESIVKHLETCPFIESFEPANDTELRVKYYGPIYNFDPMKAENKKFGASEEKKKILDIFASYNEEYELWTEANLYMSPNRKTVYANKNSVKEAERIGHPHINYFGCTGTHLRYIIDYMDSADYKGMINQVTEMILEFNFGDTIVVNEFIKRIITNKSTKIWKKLSTGEFMSTNEVLEEIKDGKTQTNN